METQPTSGERVRFWRKRKKLTLVKLEEISGIPKSRLSRIENDKQRLRSEDMEKLVEAFGISAGRFYGAEVKVAREASAS